MTTYQDNTATVENEPIAQQMPVRVIDVDFSMGDSNSASEDMPKLGTKEFEELSRSLDTRPTGYRFVKRAFDMVMSVCVLAVGIILWPIVLVMLIVIAVQTKGFPIYVQERVGQYGRTIRVPKIRTMVADSENVEKYLNEEQLEEWRKERKVTKDPRIVPAGAFLRKTSLDELTNFMVVLTGSIPLRILKTRPEFSEESMGAFALPAKSSTNKGKVFSQVVSCFASGLRMRRISWFNCKRVGSMEGQFLAKPVFRAVCA